jgi:AbrB family looped-hinge helix DNA binding protein
MTVQKFDATVTGKGQITIPKEIRRILGLHPHDRVSFEVGVAEEVASE